MQWNPAYCHCVLSLTICFIISFHFQECRQCDGSALCGHNKIRRECKECGGSSYCEHGKRKRRSVQRCILTISVSCALCEGRSLIALCSSFHEACRSNGVCPAHVFLPHLSAYTQACMFKRRRRIQLHTFLPGRSGAAYMRQAQEEAHVCT
jgi:hypothetical protein